MKTKITAGAQIEINDKHDYETNCAICAKPLGANSKEIMLGDKNTLITAEQYSEIFNRGGFVCTATIGSTCVNKFDASVIA